MKFVPRVNLDPGVIWMRPFGPSNSAKEMHSHVPLEVRTKCFITFSNPCSVRGYKKTKTQYGREQPDSPREKTFPAVPSPLSVSLWSEDTPPLPRTRRKIVLQMAWSPPSVAHRQPLSDYRLIFFLRCCPRAPVACHRRLTRCATGRSCRPESLASTIGPGQDACSPTPSPVRKHGRRGRPAPR